MVIEWGRGSVKLDNVELELDGQTLEGAEQFRVVKRGHGGMQVSVPGV